MRAATPLINAFTALKSAWLDNTADDDSRGFQTNPDIRAPYWVLRHQLTGAVHSSQRHEAETDLDLLLRSGNLRAFPLPGTHECLLLVNCDYVHLLRRVWLRDLSPEASAAAALRLLALGGIRSVWGTDGRCSIKEVEQTLNFVTPPRQLPDETWSGEERVSQRQWDTRLSKKPRNADSTVRTDHAVHTGWNHSRLDTPREEMTEEREPAQFGFIRTLLGSAAGPTVCELSSDELIAALIQRNLLRRTKLFGEIELSLPTTGAFVANLTKGRKILTRYLRRQKCREMLADQLVLKCEPALLREGCGLSANYLVRDLVGSGRLLEVRRPGCAALLRLP